MVEVAVFAPVNAYAAIRELAGIQVSPRHQGLHDWGTDPLVDNCR